MSIPEFLSSMQSSEVFNEFHVEHYMQASQIKPQTLFLGWVLDPRADGRSGVTHLSSLQ